MTQALDTREHSADATMPLVSRYVCQRSYLIYYHSQFFCIGIASAPRVSEGYLKKLRTALVKRIDQIKECCALVKVYRFHFARSHYVVDRNSFQHQNLSQGLFRDHQIRVIAG